MGQIASIDENQTPEEISIQVNDPHFDFLQAKEMAKKTALEKCRNPMILSWKNVVSGETYPDYECGLSDRPFWVRYAEGRGANLTIDFNNGKYVFMILKM